jgi:hypothetical protein
MATASDGGQAAGMEMRSQLVRTTDDGRQLGTARITNSPQKLRRGLYVAAPIQAHWQVRPAAAASHGRPGWPRVTEAVERLAAAEATVARGDAPIRAGRPAGPRHFARSSRRFRLW